ncbi:cation efflux family-domain-containing protein [Pavlovales sp. CCMP2436]|nr:cation efflux family-domain-containing protein [Pavlovales sp. CCMP2436]
MRGPSPETDGGGDDGTGTRDAPGKRDSALRAANQITLVGVAVNIVSVAGKGAGGVLANSPGLIADAAHSLTDLLSDVVTLAAVNSARVPATHSAPWGLGKLEAVGGSVCAAIIVSTGVGVGVHSSLDLWAKLFPPAGAAHLAELASHATLHMGVLGDMNAAYEWLYRETMRIGLEARSLSMVANAWHHRTDALSSVVALGGLLGTSLGFPALDSIAGLAVAAMVTRVGGQMGVSAVQELVDSQVERETLDQVNALIRSCPDVLSTTHLRGRKLGPYLAFELRMQVPFYFSVSAAQQVATKAKLRVFEAMPEVWEVSISVDAERPARTDFSRDVIVGATIQPSGLELMRRRGDYDADVRAAIALAPGLAGEGGVWGVSHSQLHWNTRKGGAIIEASLVMDPSVSVGHAHALSRRVRQAVLATAPDVIEMDCHLELFDKESESVPSTAAQLPEAWRLPSAIAAAAWLRDSRAQQNSESGCGEPPGAKAGSSASL